MAYSWDASNYPFQQASYGSSFTSGTIFFTNTTPPTIGELMVGFLCISSGSTLTAVTDTAGNTYTVGTPSTAALGYVIWPFYAPITATGGTNYIHATISATSAGGYGAYVGELVGAPSTGYVGPQNSATGTSSSSTLSLSGITAGSAIISYILVSTGPTPGAGSGYSISSTNNGTYGFGGEYNTSLSSAGGTVSVPFTSLGSGTWTQNAMAFNPTPSNIASIAWVQ